MKYYWAILHKENHHLVFDFSSNFPFIFTNKKKAIIKLFWLSGKNKSDLILKKIKIIEDN